MIIKKKEKLMNNLRRIRREQEMSQHELSRKTWIPQSTLSLIERFYQKPSQQMKKKISNALGDRLEVVFPEEDRKS